MFYVASGLVPRNGRQVAEMLSILDNSRYVIQA